MKPSFFGTLCAILACFAATVSASDVRPLANSKTTIKNFRVKNLKEQVPHNLQYHNGSIMTGSVKIYFIFYGQWQKPSMTLLEDFVNNLSATSWWNINKLFKDKKGVFAAGSLHVASSITDNYSQGKALNSGNIERIITTALSKKTLPTDANGIYIVLSSADVKAQNFCNPWCAYHSFVTYQKLDIKYAFAGDASTQCPDSCQYDPKLSPNGLPGADALANHIAHEITETVTDPKFDAWENPENGDFEENADKCAWQFGKTTKLPNGAVSNIIVGGKPFLVQMNWNPVTNKCAQSA